MRPAALALGAALLLVATAGRSHQLKAAISTALFNPRTGNIEVMHRFYSHDAEHALRLLTGDSADLIGNQRDRLRFAVYVHEQFDLGALGADLEPLTLVGAELEGDFLWVYQRTPIPPQIDGIEARFDALRELWPSQVNTLNVERNGAVSTLTFDGDDTVLRLRF